MMKRYPGREPVQAGLADQKMGLHCVAFHQVRLETLAEGRKSGNHSPVKTASFGNRIDRNRHLASRLNEKIGLVRALEDGDGHLDGRPHFARTGHAGKLQ